MKSHREALTRFVLIEKLLFKMAILLPQNKLCIVRPFESQEDFIKNAKNFSTAKCNYKHYYLITSDTFIGNAVKKSVIKILK